MGVTFQLLNSGKSQKIFFKLIWFAIIFFISSALLRGMCQHIFSPKLTEPIKLFVIPALVELPNFPFRQLIEVIRDSPNSEEEAKIPLSFPHSTGLLFAVLTLEKKHFCKFF